MPLVSGEFGTHREYFGKVLSCLSVLQMDAEQELITISLKIMKCTKLDVLHLYSAICMASEVLLVNHLYSAPSQGRLWQCRLGFEHDTLRLPPLPPYAGTQPIRPTCTMSAVRVH